MPDEPEEEEITEINEDTIKQLAAQAAGQGGGDDEPEEEEEPAPAAASGEVNPQQLNVELERVKSTIDMIKEQSSSTADRIQNFSQSVGEIRQMVHEQSTDVTKVQTDIDKIKDLVDGLEPQEIKKDISKVQGKVDNTQARIEALDDRMDTLEKKVNDAQTTLKSMGSLDNLIELNKDFDKKINEIKEAVRYIERLARKSEKINIQINKKLNDFDMYKAKVDTLMETVNENVRDLDDVKIDVQEAVTQDEVPPILERIRELEEQLSELNAVVPLAEMSMPEPIVELREQRADIENFLDELEREYSSGSIEASEYEQIKEANEEKLKKVNQRLVYEWKRVEEVISEGEDIGNLTAEDLDKAEVEGERPPDDPSSSDDGAAEEDSEAAEETDAEDGEENDGADGEEDAEEDGDDDTETEAAEKEQDAADEDADGSEEQEEDESADAEEDGEDAAEEASGSLKEQYMAILEGSVDEIKQTVSEQNLDLEVLLALEKQNKARSSLVTWLESKTGD